MKKMYEPLFESMTLPNGVELKNRFVVAPMTTVAANDDGTVSDAELAYYAARSNGVGMFITACIASSPSGISFPNQFIGFDEKILPRLSMLAETIKRGGAKAVLQIQHGGRKTPPSLVDGDVVSSSPVASPQNLDAEGNPVVPRELSIEEIEGIIADFGQVTRFALEAGFDGVEIHGANTYLIQQFFSPLTNVREDLWGGSVDKRMTFPLQIVNEVQKVVRESGRKDFIVGYRFSPEEYEDGGIRLAQTLQLVDRLAGYSLDYLHISIPQAVMGPRMEAESTDALVKQVQTVIDGRVPLISVGSIFTPAQALAALDTGANLVALGRSIIIDPQWVEKVEDEKESDIVTEFDAELANAIHVPEKMKAWILSKPGWFPGVK